MMVPGRFRDAFQIVHIDAFCNECGNCATFCPWEGRPYKDKLTVFASEEDFIDSTNPGFFLRGGSGKIRVNGEVGGLTVDGARKVSAEVGGPGTVAVVQAVVRGYSYLLGGRE